MQTVLNNSRGNDLESPQMKVNRPNAVVDDLREKVDVLTDTICKIKEQHAQERRELLNEIIILQQQIKTLETNHRKTLQKEDYSDIRNYIDRRLTDIESSQNHKLKQIIQSKDILYKDQ